MKTDILYQDSLILIKDDLMELKKYYYPSMSSKIIDLDKIERIDVKEATLMNGKWRIHGTGNFRTWFPKDLHRPKSDKIFLVTYKDRWMRSGFTVENSEEVRNIFKSKGMIK